MRLLKIFLYMILTCCFLYATIYWFGGLILKQSVKFYFGDRVSLNEVSISPKLTLRIGRVDYNLEEEDPLFSGTGSLRAVDVTWTVLGSQPSLLVSASSIEHESVFNLHRASILFEFPSIAGWSKPAFHFEASNFETPFGFRVEHLRTEGLANLIDSSLGETFFELKNLSHSGSSLQVENVEGHLSKFTYLKFPKTQLENFAVRVIDFQIGSIMSETLEGEVRLIPNVKGLEVHSPLPQLTVGNEVIELSDLVIRSTLERQALNFFDDLEFTASGVRSSFLGMSLKDFIGKLEQKDDELVSSIKGVISDLQLFNNGQFIGRLDNFDFNSGIQANKNHSGWKINQSNYLSSKKSPDLALESNIEFQANETTNFIACLSIFCDFTNLATNFQLIIDDHVAVMTASCHTYPCDDGATGVVSTSDTISIFNALSDTKIFNPFFVALVFSELSRGRKLGSGHELIFSLN